MENIGQEHLPDSEIYARKKVHTKNPNTGTYLKEKLDKYAVKLIGKSQPKVVDVSSAISYVR